MGNRFKTFLLVGALVGLLVMGVRHFEPYFTTHSAEPESSVRPLRECMVGLGDISNRISIAGKIQPATVEEIVCRVEGRIGAVLVQEGQRVKQGDVLIQLNEADLKRKIEDARIKYIKAKSEAAELDTWKQSPSYLTVKYQLETAQTDYEESQRTYTENKGLFEQKAISRHDLHESELELRRREIALETAKVQLAEQEKKGNQLARQKANSELLVAQSELDERQAALKYKDIIAPCDGIISFERGQPVQQNTQHLTLTKNRTVNAGEFLIKIENHSRFVVNARVNEFDAVRLNSGIPCEIYVPAIPNEEFSGTISDIYPVASGGDRTFFVVRCLIDQLDTPLKSGLTAEVDIILGEKTDILVIPLSALVAGDDQKGVLVAEKDGKASFIPVEIGLKNEDQVEIVSGLEEGQRIVCRITADLLKATRSDGSKQ
jgi:HlyD family secretion protein